MDAYCVAAVGLCRDKPTKSLEDLKTVLVKFEYNLGETHALEGELMFTKSR